MHCFQFPEDTIQPAPTEDCVLDCPKTDKPCALSTCCGPAKHVCIPTILLLIKICNEHVGSYGRGRHKEHRNEKLCTVLYS
jgi:hypothetical protein